MLSNAELLDNDGSGGLIKKLIIAIGAGLIGSVGSGVVLQRALAHEIKKGRIGRQEATKRWIWGVLISGFVGATIGWNFS